MTETKTRSPTEVLKPEEAQAVEEFKERLLASLPDQVRDIILFGSKARGDGHSESDVDLLVVVEQRTPEVDDVISAITADILLDTGVDISALDFTRSEITACSTIGTPLMRNVAEEGIVLKGEAIVVYERKRDFSPGDAQGAIEQATEFVEVIEKLLPSLWEE